MNIVSGFSKARNSPEAARQNGHILEVKERMVEVDTKRNTKEVTKRPYSVFPILIWCVLVS